MHHNRSIGIYESDRFVVFGLNQQTTAWQGRLKSGELTIQETLDETAQETAKQGMALFRVADDLYLQRRYRVLSPPPH